METPVLRIGLCCEPGKDLECRCPVCRDLLQVAVGDAVAILIGVLVPAKPDSDGHAPAKQHRDERYSDLVRLLREDALPGVAGKPALKQRDD